MNLFPTILALAVIALGALTLVATGVFPRTRWGERDSFNSLFTVRMQSIEFYAASNQSMRGVHAQERVECFLRWLVTLTIVGAVLTRTRWFRRQSELIGHAAEIVVAARVGFDLESYLHDEAARTYRSAAYDGVFADLDVEGMKRALRRRFDAARVLVAVNALAIAWGFPGAPE